MANQNQNGLTPAEVVKYLKGVGYPAEKRDPIDRVRANGAPQDVLQTLQRLPDDRFKGAPGVTKAFGQIK